VELLGNVSIDQESAEHSHSHVIKSYHSIMNIKKFFINMVAAIHFNLRIQKRNQISFININLVSNIPFE
jgi:hypothetical protein